MGFNSWSDSHRLLMSECYAMEASAETSRRAAFAFFPPLNCGPLMEDLPSYGGTKNKQTEERPEHLRHLLPCGHRDTERLMSERRHPKFKESVACWLTWQLARALSFSHILLFVILLFPTAG